MADTVIFSMLIYDISVMFADVGTSDTPILIDKIILVSS